MWLVRKLIMILWELIQWILILVVVFALCAIFVFIFMQLIQWGINSAAKG